MRNVVAGAMTVLGTLLILAGAGIIILRAWPRAGAPAADDAATAGTTASPVTWGTPAERAAAEKPSFRVVRQLGPPERLILWGTILLVLAAIAAGAIGFNLGAEATAK
jgi:hypothetical protein